MKNSGAGSVGACDERFAMIFGGQGTTDAKHGLLVRKQVFLSPGLNAVSELLRASDSKDSYAITSHLLTASASYQRRCDRQCSGVHPPNLGTFVHRRR